MRVYIFNDYEEHGPDNIRVAGSPEAARRIFDELLMAYVPPDDWREDPKQERLKYLAECRYSFETFMIAESTSGGDLGSGWGGLQLHIVDVEN